MIPFFTIAMVILCVAVTVSTRQDNRKIKEVNDAFWKRELEANSTRKQDITGLDYITIPLEELPQDEALESYQRLQDLSQKKILNLTGISNTDLKLQYGVANLEFLSDCDANFADLVKALDDYAKELLSLDKTREAQKVLEYAVSLPADSLSIYESLGRLYQKEGQLTEIQNLIVSAQSLPGMQGDLIVDRLQKLTGSQVSA